MKIGILYLMQCPDSKSPADVYHETLDQVDAAEELGFDSVWLTEHHFTNKTHDEHWLLGGEYGVCTSPLAFGCAIAGRTKRLRIGQAVNVLALHQPLDVAEQAAVLDIVSQGRLDFGAGLGYRTYQFEGYGIDESEKLDRFYESLDIVESAWTKDSFAYDGKHYQVPEVGVVPKPVQQPRPPIWLAPTRYWNDEALVYAARRGYRPLLAWASDDQLREGREKLREAYSQAEGASGEFEFAVTRHVFVGENDEDAHATAEPGLEYYYRHTAPTRSIKDYERDAWIVGSPETALAKLKHLESLGVDHMLLWFAYGTLSHDDVIGSMQRFSEHVMPGLTTSAVAARR